MKRHELTDEQWIIIKPILPKRTATTGRKPRDPRDMLNGILWILRTGAPWRDLPERFGPWQTVYDYYRHWRDDGTFDQMVQDLQIRLDREGKIDWDLWCIDGSSVRASRAAAGQCHESTQIQTVLDGISVPQPVGHPRKRPARLAGDKAYSFGSVRRWLYAHGIEAIIPNRSNQKKLTRPFDKQSYKRRCVIEQCVGWLKECRRIATRFEKLGISFLAMFKLAMMQRYLKIAFSDRA